MGCVICNKPIDETLGICNEGHTNADRENFLRGYEIGKNFFPSSPRQVHPPKTPPRQVAVGALCVICHTPNDEVGTCNRFHSPEEQVAQTNQKLGS